jgi:hypothetical protein
MNNDKPIINDDPIITQTSPSQHDPVIQPPSESTAISVDSDSTLTPITKQEIKQVSAHEWENLTVGQLYDQLLILQQRKFSCQQHAPLMVNDIERGIKQLQLIIDKKFGNEVKLL